MSLEVIAVGFGRTGTTSLKAALEKLGFRKCHHMREVFENRDQTDHWWRLSQGEPADWEAIFEGYRATCDWPSVSYWQQLVDHYPDAKVILTTREEERWYRSVAETIYKSSNGIPTWLGWLVPRVRRLKQMIARTVWEGDLEGRFEDEAHARKLFREHAERVKAKVPAERLLVFEARDGWEPLCAHLGVPVPEGPYPHLNDAAEIKRFLPVLAFLRWLPALVVAVIGIALLL